MNGNNELRVETVVYVTRETDGGTEVLLIHRDKSPNIGIWVPLGETILFDESPYDNAIKAAKEAGIIAKKLEFRGLVTELSPKIQWHLFLYVVTEFEGESLSHTSAGELKWVHVNNLSQLKMPQSDGVMGPEILVNKVKFYEARMHFTEDMNLLRTDVTPY